MRRNLVAGADDLQIMVAAMPVPVLVADYTPIIERFAGVDGETIRQMLQDDDLLGECLSLPNAIAASPEWVRLYGSPLFSDAPDLTDRHFSSESYPELRRALVRQFTAPFFGTTSIVSEHTAPTLLGRVIVRSHWKATLDGDRPMWDRIVIVDLDVSDLRRTQGHLEEALAIQRKLVESKDQLIASVSHEIRTPLSAIVGFARLLHESAEDSPEERHEMLSVVVQQSADLANIVDDLLVVAKLDMGQLEVSRVGVDLRAQAAQAVEGLAPDARRSIICPEETVRCFGDPARVRQVVRNLISNALRYGGPSIAIRVRSGDGFGSLIVADDGEGIPEECRGWIFDPYVRGDQPPGLTPSLGLGLHISRTLAGRMGGSLTYSYVGGESIFELRLPLEDARVTVAA